MSYPNIFGTFDTILFIVLIALIWILLSKSKSIGIERTFLLGGFLLKAIATPLYLLYHKYVQKVGDVFQYQLDATYLTNIFYKDPITYAKMIFSNTNELEQLGVNFNQNMFLADSDEAIVSKIGSIVGIFINESFLGISLIFSLFAFGGCWQIFKVYKRLYPDLIKTIGLAVLFIPSIVFWSTCITKDALSLGVLGFLTHSLFKLFLFKENFFLNIIIVIAGISFFLSVKIYILMAILPALFFLFMLKFIRSIKSPILKGLVVPVLFTLLFICMFYGLDYLGSIATKFALENLSKTILTNYVYLSVDTHAGSSYDLGTIEPNFNSILSKFLAAVNVTMFRPFLWEIKNLAMALSSFESTFTLILSLYVVFKVGLIRVFKISLINTDVLFGIIFSTIFAFAVGITSGNFGTLLRYKIPILPFYFTSLAIIYSTKKKPLQ